MKIGRLNIILKRFAKSKRMKTSDLRVLILLSECMWADAHEMRRDLTMANKTVYESIKQLTDRKYIKIARINNNFAGLKRMYCITQKGRFVSVEFLNLLNY